MIRISYLLCSCTATSGDFSALLSAPLTFPLQSVNGEQICANLTVVADNLVESEENFTISLDLITLNEILTVGNAVVVVTITDIDGILALYLVAAFK